MAKPEMMARMLDIETVQRILQGTVGIADP